MTSSVSPSLRSSAVFASHQRLDRAQQVGGERRVVVEQVLEAGGEVDLGGLDLREAVEQLVGQGRRAVLDGAREAVLAADGREAPQRLEVELDLGHAAAGQRHAAVARCRSGR